MTRLNQKEQVNVVIAAGGTGGHLFPAQALSEELRRRQCHNALITDVRGLRWKEQFPSALVFSVASGTTTNRGFLNRLRAVFHLFIGTVQAWLLIGRMRPKVVIGFGGYPMLPTLFAALVRNLPTCIHEQNGVMGRANRLVASRVNAIALSIADPVGLGSNEKSKVLVTGNPVRQTVIELRGRSYPSLDDEGEIKLLVFGGSQGARVFSDLLPKSLSLLTSSLRDRLTVTQQCRDEDERELRRAYENAGIEAEIATFFVDLPQRIADSHLVISRSGASTVSELSVIGRPAILVPLPSALDGDQSANAAYFEKANAGWLLREDGLTAEVLAQNISGLLKTPERLRQAAASAWSLGKPGAVVALADLVERLASTQASRPAVLESA